MSFLNPLVLLGLAAAAIPLLIHLFNFRQPRKVDFSTLAFLQDLQKSTMRRVRVQQWLLLALRTLAVVCLVLAFARPRVAGPWAALFGAQLPTSTALVIDNSLSMTVRDAQGDYLGQARDLAAALLGTMQPGDEVFLVPTAPLDATRPEAFSQPGPALDALAALTPQPGARTVGAAVAQAAGLLEGARNPQRRLVVVSDAQASMFVDSARVGLPADLAVTLLPLGDAPAASVAVTEARVESRVVEAGQPVTLAATLVNYGPAPVADAVASVFLDGQRVAQATATLPPGIPTPVTFTATPPTRGWLAGEVRVEPDDFEPDDVRHFVLSVPETRRVLVVRGTGQRSDYLELALSLARLAPGDARAGAAAFDVRTVDETALPAQDLAQTDVVVLLGLESLSTGEQAGLTRFVQGGGGVLVFTGDRGAAEVSALLATLGGGRLAATPTGTPGSNRPIGRFDRVDLEHPLFAGIFGASRDGGAPTLESPDVFAALAYTPGGGDEQTLITLSNGLPFLHELRSGPGALLLVPTLPDPRWSDLAVRGLFVPLLYRAAFYLAADADDGQPPLLVRTPGTLRIAGVTEAQPLRLVRAVPPPDEQIPAQRALPGGVLLEFDASAFSAPGVYDVRQGEVLRRRVAVNADPREFDLARLAPDDARARLADATGRPVALLDAAHGRGFAAAHELDTLGGSVELWRVFLALALLFLVAESLVAMRWKGRPAAVGA